jgi:hypothetical protein
LEEGRIKRTVDGDADKVSDLLDLRPSQFERTKIPEHEVTVGSARLELIPILDKLIRKRPRVFDHLLRICLPRWLRRLQQRGCDSRNGVVVGPALTCGENGIIHALLEVFVSLVILAEEDEARTGATKRFVSTRALLRHLTVPRNNRHLRCGRYDVAVLEGVSEFLSGDKTRCMSDIRHQICPVLISDLAKCFIIPIAGICGSAANDETWLEDARLRGKARVINKLRGRV